MTMYPASASADEAMIGFDAETAPRPLDDAGRRRSPVLGSPIDLVSWTEAIERVDAWAAQRESRYVCACNVHSVTAACGDAQLASALEGADLCVPDGAPVAWMLRHTAAPSQQRISGPDLMWNYFAHAQRTGRSVFLYGSDPRTVSQLRDRIGETFPALRIAGSHCPPYRELTAEEDAEVVDLINRSGAQTVWISLGCPRQEKWMAAHRPRIQAVMFGVGAAFGFHARTVARAPEWMQLCGLEWLYRFAREPRRLWRRYLSTNTVFIVRAGLQLLGARQTRRTSK